MTALSLTYSLVNGTTADANEVETNFLDIRNYINANVVRTDGVNAMAAALALDGNDPTAAAHAVNKNYMDGPVVLAVGSVSQNWTADTFQALKFATKSWDAENGTNGAGNYDLTTGIFTAPTTGIYQVSFGFQPTPVSSAAVYGARTVYNVTNINGVRFKADDWVSGTGSQQPIATMTSAWRVAAGDTITPSLFLDATTSKALGEWLSIVWLHA